MKIGIIAAMKEEVELLRNQIEIYQTTSFGRSKFYDGQLEGVEIVLLQSGIGKVAATLGTTILIERYNPDFIINTGSAGSLLPTLNIGDIIISEETSYHDVNVTAFGYALGQIPDYPLSFKADKNLIFMTERCAEKLHFNVIKGLIVTGDTFVNDSSEIKKILKNFPKAIAVEMEATAIAHVCYNFNVPFVMVRTISDASDQQSHIIFNKSIAITAKKCMLIVKTLVKKLKVK